MQLPKKILTRFPRLEILLRSLYYRFQGTPPLSYSEISKELIRECVGREDPTILEIGCNDGFHTLWFLEIFKNPKIYCFEPDPRAIARFKAKVGRQSNVDLFEIALSDHNGEITFYQSDGQLNEEQTNAMPEGWDCSGSIRQPKEHLKDIPWVTFNQKITVPTSTLDTWCSKHGIADVDFIWMDVQGAEIDVFKGGINTLAKTHFLYTEYNNKELYEGQLNLKQLIKYLKNFSVLIRYRSDVLLVNRQLGGVNNKAQLRKLANLHH
jgi:2-O-methyltransferase